jgi:hypothetical protein
MSDDDRGWHEPDPEKKQIWRDRLKELEAVVKAIPWDDESRKEERWEAEKASNAHYNSCPECGGTKLELLHYDMMWHDGDLICENCRCYVRGFDAG